MYKTTIMFSMKMDVTLHKRLKREAVESGKTMAELIINGLAKMNIEAEKGSEDEKDSNRE